MESTSQALEMARRKPILIACPQYRVLVRGTYELDESGRCPLDKEGNFLLHRVGCEHYGGRCMQTLCVLHRHNRRGGGSWYPERILAAPDASAARKQRTRRQGPEPGPADRPNIDTLA